MKNILVLLSFCFLIVLIAFQINLILTQEITIVEDVMSVESEKLTFDFIELSGDSYTDNDLTNETPIIIMLFDPTCIKCEEMTNKILKNFYHFSNHQLLLVSSSDPTNVRDFVEKNSIGDYTNVKVLLDEKEYLYDQYGLFQVPSFVIFNKKRELVAVLDEFFNFSILIKYAEQSNS